MDLNAIVQLLRKGSGIWIPWNNGQCGGAWECTLDIVYSSLFQPGNRGGGDRDDECLRVLTQNFCRLSGELGTVHVRVVAFNYRAWSSPHFSTILGGFTLHVIPSTQSDRLSGYLRQISISSRSFLNPFRQRGGQHGELYLPPIFSVFS